MGASHCGGFHCFFHGKKICVPFYHENMGENPEWLRKHQLNPRRDLAINVVWIIKNLCGYEKILRWLLSWWVFGRCWVYTKTPMKNSWYVYREKSGTRRWWNRSTFAKNGQSNMASTVVPRTEAEWKPLIIFPLVICSIAMENGP